MFAEFAREMNLRQASEWPITGSKIIANDEEFVSEYAFRSEVWQDGEPKGGRSNEPITDKWLAYVAPSKERLARFRYL
jgi:hypothetical protein